VQLLPINGPQAFAENWKAKYPQALERCLQQRGNDKAVEETDYHG
jgi:hypothetical protein